MFTEELESQVKDLQEVNETTAGNLVHTEKELEQLKTENEVLRKNRNRKILELEDDITRLKQQVMSKHENNASNSRLC